MNNRHISYILLAAVVACSVSVLMVMMQIDRTRHHLAESNPGAINNIFQIYRNLDLLQDELTDLLLQTEPDFDQQWQKVRTRFDIVWSRFAVAKFSAPTAAQPLPGELELKRQSRVFLAENDAFFSNPQLPDSDTLVGVLQGTRNLNANTHAIGIQYFRSAGRFRDDLNARMNKLYRYLWISALLLLVATSLLVWRLFRLNAESQRMFKNARTSEAQLSQVVDELRSGRQEQKAKDSFLAAASHDLRQPLHALGLFVSALENKVVKPEGLAILDKVKQSTAALNTLFNSLLDISRLDAGVVEAVPEHFFIGDLLDNLNEEFAEVASRRGLTIEFSYHDQIAYTDEVLLRRILRNLIDNAIVYSDAGRISVSCAQKGKKLHLYVSDQGPGIPLDEQPYVFSEYYQLDNPERDRSKGLGLGLSIVRRLSDLLGIDVEMISRPGKGTQFQLRVPAGKREEISAQEDADPETEQTYDFDGRMIMVIDDERDVREGMELILSQANCVVRTAESAWAACEDVVENDLVPDLIIADYRLREDKTGLQAVYALREELNEDIPAFIITGDTTPERVREVSDSGMQLMHKPVVPAQLFRTVSSVLAKVQLDEVG